jgi:hypothetical protein
MKAKEKRVLKISALISVLVLAFLTYVELWYRATHKSPKLIVQKRILSYYKGPVWAGKFSPDDNSFLSGSVNGKQLLPI